MRELTPSETLIKGWRKILLFALVAAVFSAGLSFLFPLQYSSSMRLLIIQQQLSQADPYTAIKASERIADNLAQIVYTTSFFDKVMNAKYNIDQTIFKQDEEKKRRQWRKMISTQVLRGSGMLVVTVYHVDPDQAEQIARALRIAPEQVNIKATTSENLGFIGEGKGIAAYAVVLLKEDILAKNPDNACLPGRTFHILQPG